MPTFSLTKLPYKNITLQTFVMTLVNHIFREEELPPRTPTQIVKETCIGASVGLVVGYVFKRVGRLAVTTVGGGITCISCKKFYTMIDL